MNPADYTNTDAGWVVQTPQGYAAFVPAPLPPELVYDPALVLALSRADAAHTCRLAGLAAVLSRGRSGYGQEGRGAGREAVCVA